LVSVKVKTLLKDTLQMMPNKQWLCPQIDSPIFTHSKISTTDKV
jgi:hypothetical protein